MGHTFRTNSFQAAQLLRLLFVFVLFPIALIKNTLPKETDGEKFILAQDSELHTVYHCRMVKATGTRSS